MVHGCNIGTKLNGFIIVVNTFTRIKNRGGNRAGWVGFGFG
jgi:hypothetical protein